MGKIFGSQHFLGSRKKNYFEGWYFRHAGDYPFSFIAGVSKSLNDSHSFIQYIDSEKSGYFRFPSDAFSYGKKKMTVSVGGNVFSEDGITADIKNDKLRITADLKYGNFLKLKKSVYTPSVMGPFSYLPMPCSHSVVSLSHGFGGKLTVDGKELALSGNGYIEKDYGDSFPENYFWLHASGADTGIMCAVAWPLIFNIRGFLCVIACNGIQKNLSLYTGAKLDKFSLTPQTAELSIKKGKTRLTVSAESNGFERRLTAPAPGGLMNKDINENLSASVKAELILNGKTIDLSAVKYSAFESVLK